MSSATLQDAIFRLGMVSADPRRTNHDLLRAMGAIAADALGLDMVTIAVHEHGLLAPATACWVHGPWSAEQCDALAEHAQWAASERPGAAAMAGEDAGRLRLRTSLLSEDAFGATRLRRELHEPMGVGDEALVRFRRDLDGAEVLLRFGLVGRDGPMPPDVAELAAKLAPFLADCWARGWRHEPEWLSALKPNSRRVLELVLEGLDDAQIADRTGLTYHSVRAHLKRLFKDADVRSRLHLMQKCWSFNGVARTSAIRAESVLMGVG